MTAIADIRRDLARRRPHLHPDFETLASNQIELLDRLIAGDPPELIRPRLERQVKFWNRRREAMR